MKLESCDLDNKSAPPEGVVESHSDAPEGALPSQIAVVHDWLPEMGGAEKVLREILQVFPTADVFALLDFLPAEERGFLRGHRLTTSFLQRAPFARTHYRQYLPLMPLAVEHFDLASYPLILSSSYAVAKGVLSGPDQLHLCYCHSPVRYAWDLQEQYLRQTGRSRGVRGLFARALLQYIRLWDLRTPNGVDAFAANSRFIARRIWKVYRRRARVIYPPAVSDGFPGASPRVNSGDFYLSLGRLVPYKRVDLLLDVFRGMPERRLRVIGAGPEFGTLNRNRPSNVELLGRQPQSVVERSLRESRALIFAAEEDFGIAPVEAQAQGTPVIAYAKGGVLETVHHGRTGILYAEQTVESLREAIEIRERTDFDPMVLRHNAERFSCSEFRRALRQWVAEEWGHFHETRRHEEAGGTAAEGVDAFSRNATGETESE
jgi:glycosyltransferase involved in cell wall biosynthesis